MAEIDEWLRLQTLDGLEQSPVWGSQGLAEDGGQALDRVRSRGMPLAPQADDIALVDHDPKALVDLLGDNPQAHRTVLGLLLSSLDVAQAELQAHAATGRWSELAGVAHRLKSSARASGARYLGELLHRLEVSGRADGAPGVRELLPRLTPAIDRLRAQLRLDSV